MIVGYRANLRDLITATAPVILLKIGFKSSICFACATLKFDGWPRKTIGHLFYTTSSFAHHFKSHGEIQTGVTVRKCSRVKIGDFYPVWPWNLTDDLENQYNTSSILLSISEFKMELQSGNAEFGSKSAIICSAWPWNLMDDLEKQ